LSLITKLVKIIDKDFSNTLSKEEIWEFVLAQRLNNSVSKLQVSEMFKEASAHRIITKSFLSEAPLTEMEVYNITRLKYRCDYRTGKRTVLSSKYREKWIILIESLGETIPRGSKLKDLKINPIKAAY